MRITKEQIKTNERAEAVEVLRKMGVIEGSTLWTSVSHVARSGMSRTVHVYIVDENRDIIEVSGLVARATGLKQDQKSGGIVRGGCGMDLCWDTVYHLGRVMFPNGGSLDKSPRKHQESRAGKTREENGGYLLKHRGL